MPGTSTASKSFPPPDVFALYAATGKSSRFAMARPFFTCCSASVSFSKRNDDSREVGVVDERELHAELGAHCLREVVVDTLDLRGAFLEELDRRVLDVGADLDLFARLDRRRQLREEGALRGRRRVSFPL